MLHRFIVVSNLAEMASSVFKEFQWKCLHNINYTEHRLKKMNLSNGRCHLCQIRDNDETMQHLFFKRYFTIYVILDFTPYEKNVSFQFLIFINNPYFTQIFSLFLQYLTHYCTGNVVYLIPLKKLFQVLQ
jgi:hypothetical protein